MAKKLKRLLSAVLSAVLCLSCMVSPALAVAGDDIVIPIDKTAKGLTDDFLADVNLQVGGDSFMDPVDIIFIVGGGASSESSTINEAIKLFESLLVKDIPVRLGIVGLQVMPYTILDLNSAEADLRQYYLEGKLEEFVTEKYNSILDDYLSGKLYDGTTNLDHALNVAWEMFKKDTTGVKDENKFVFTISTGRTYWFDNEDGLESTVIAVKKDSNGGNHYLWGNYLWRRMRSGGTSSDYVIPKKYNNSFAAYWTDLVSLIGEDGDKYVYTPEGQSDDAWFTNWSSNANNGGEYVADGRYGQEIDSPLPSGANFATGVVDAVPHQERLDTNIIHALNYERAQYEAWLTYTAMDNVYNMFAICSELPKYQNNSTNNSISHSFMDFLAGGKAPILGTDGFFQPIADQIKKTHVLAEGSYVEDYMGYNDGTNGKDPYNFDFVNDASTLALYVGSDKYTATSIATTAGATSTYSFKDGKFILDYYYGDGATGEYFKWTFNEIVSSDAPVSLDYKVKLVLKPTTPGDHILDTNRVATLYPVDSENKEGTPKEFPVPNVPYEVSPYDVDIVLAIGGGIAQYQNTYDSIVSLVKPLVDEGVRVKLGLIAVECYDDVAMGLTPLTKDNYEDIIKSGLDIIMSMPFGPTNLEGNILAAKDMLDADDSVPAGNKFFHVIATGRTYCFDDANGNPATIINQVDLKGKTYYYWGHYLWQSQRGRHTSLYMIPDRYNNDYEAFFADIEKWVAADGDKYVYSFPAYDTTNSSWYSDYYSANTKDAKALGLASSRFGWIFQNPAIEAETPAIGSGVNPANALNYERGQYDAYKAFQSMKDAGYNCYALCSESTSYQNNSPYIKNVAKYSGTSTSQLGHSFMNFLNGGEATLLFVLTDANTGASKMAEDFFTKVDTSNLAVSTESVSKGPIMMAPRPNVSTSGSGTVVEEAIKIVSQPVNGEAVLDAPVSVSVEAEGEGLKYQWYFRNAGAKSFSKSSIKSATYETDLTKARVGREIYCVITDANGNKVTTDTVKLVRVAAVDLAIKKQPVNGEAVLGDTVSVSVEAEGEGLKYQWYFRNAGAKSFSKSSIKTATYETEMDKTRAGREIYCEITDVCGNKVTSDIVKLIRIQAVELELIAQTEEAAAAIGEKVSVTVEAKGEDLTYQWYFRNAKASKFSKSSVKTATYETEIKSGTIGRQVYCVITDAFGNQVQSDIVTLNCLED